MEKIVDAQMIEKELERINSVLGCRKNINENRVSKRTFGKRNLIRLVSLDVSLFVPLTVTVLDLQNRIKQVDARIHKVELVDSFKKDDWQNKKSLTFRYHFVDQNKTLSGEEIAVIQQHVESAVQKSGASVR